jgi:hypothetical protein
MASGPTRLSDHYRTLTVSSRAGVRSPGLRWLPRALMVLGGLGARATPLVVQARDAAGDMLEAGKERVPELLGRGRELADTAVQKLRTPH